jgi:hypothetical protein
LACFCKSAKIFWKSMAAGSLHRWLGLARM